ncbi:hypothetical protein FHP05_15205 [Cerasibacillus terrae]|uniref:Uncharacterized protein n=1 Tax=Cerasibacillus terrae TaxID=2498845 RepID=A0A5C8NGF8_9BACI|nr:hypothetical protein [Cerasibacillus terrae]TXL56658.1 hypothetical protein FHP05_15205 [Cerasibacillus terrae]
MNYNQNHKIMQIKGLAVGLYEIAKGLLTLVLDAGIVVLSDIIPDIIEPEGLKQAANDRVETYKQTMKHIIFSLLIIFYICISQTTNTNSAESELIYSIRANMTQLRSISDLHLVDTQDEGIYGP